MNHVIVDVRRVLRETGHEESFKRTLQLSPLEKNGEKIEFEDGVVADLRLINTGSGVLVAGRVEGRVKIACSRCLCDFTMPAAFDMEELFTSKAPEEEKYAVADDKIDLGPVIEEGFILEIPIAPLCDAECKGLCPACGGNLNLEECHHEVEEFDERLSELKKWLEQEERKEGK